VGCFAMGALADFLGRKPCGIFANILVALGGYVSAIAPNARVLMACRFVVGLGVGAAFVPVDMLAEACPESSRSTKTQIANLSFSIGVVLITIIGMFVLDPYGWRVLAFFTALPPTAALVMTFYLDESPTWLAARGRGEKAKKNLNRISLENTGRGLPAGLRVCSENDLFPSEENTLKERLLKGEDGVDRGEAVSNVTDEEKVENETEITERAGVAETRGTQDARDSASALWNLIGTPTNFFRTVCLWTLALVQTFYFYGLMLFSPQVFRKTLYFEKSGGDPGEPVMLVENLSKIAFDYPAILVVNSGDVIGNALALLALRSKINPRWVAGSCACVSIPLLFTPLNETLKTKRWGLVLVMLLGRIPAAPIGAMSWILNAVAYPTLFRATGHGYANALARFGAVAASSMYSAPPALSIPVHAVALLCAVPAAAFIPKGSLETQGGALKAVRRFFRNNNVRR